MEHLRIIQENDNKLLNFKEVRAVAPFAKTPTMNEVIKVFANKYGAAEESLIIKKIKGNFGTKNFSIIVRIYPDKKTMDSVEKKNKKLKKTAVAGGK